MKKEFGITLILCMVMHLWAYTVDSSDLGKDGDVDATDLSAFAEYFGKSRWYKDTDNNGYFDGTTVWAAYRLEGYYPKGELTTSN